MKPPFTLLAGIAVGVMGVRLTRSSNLPRVVQSTGQLSSEAVRTGLNQAGSGVRGAAVLALQAIEKTSAALQRKLNTTPSEENYKAAEEMSQTRAADGSTATAGPFPGEASS